MKMDKKHKEAVRLAQSLIFETLERGIPLSVSPEDRGVILYRLGELLDNEIIKQPELPV